MRISTKFTMLRVAIQHKKLLLKVTHPAIYKAVSALAITVILSVGVAGYLLFDSQNPKVLSASDELQIKEYSLNGKITEVQGDRITVRVNIVQTNGSSVTVSEQEKTFFVTEHSEINSVSIIGGEPVLAPAERVDLSAGKNIAVYSSTNPNSSDQISAERIELINL